MAMVSRNANIRHCARSALRPVGIPPSHGRHSALTRQLDIPPVGIRARTRFNVHFNLDKTQLLIPTLSS